MGGALYWEKIEGYIQWRKVPWEVSHLVHTICTKLPTTKRKANRASKREREREIELGGCLLVVMPWKTSKH
jgi:hypothetical protein